jgi:short-subunit dehydrogenase
MPIHPPAGAVTPPLPTALITGASSGIGLALAEQLAQHGHGLLLVARRADELGRLAARLRAEHGVAVSVCALDLCAAQAVDELQEHVRREQLEIGIVINNAGFGQLGAFCQTSWEQEERMIRLNILAATALARAFLPGLIARGSGRILNVASTAAYLPGPYMAVYYASKAYLLSWSQALSLELQGTGVTVTALCPGPTRTGFEHVAGLGGSGLFASRAVMSAEAVAMIGYRAMMRGRRVAVAGWLNRLMALATHVTPTAILMRVARRLHPH